MSNKITSASVLNMTVTLQLTEQEARALHSMTLYGADPFLEWFYKHLGKHYMQPHEQGLKSLFETINKELPSHLEKAKAARQAFNQ